MFTNLRPVFAAAAVLVSSSLAAQYSRSGSYSRSVGNSWLGGRVSVNSALSTTTSTLSTSTTRAANGSLNASVDGYVLGFSLRAAQVTFSARNSVRTGIGFGAPQSATASYRLQLAGYNVSDRSVTTTGNLGGIPERTYTLFPSDVHADVGVGPFTVSLGGNAGATLGGGAMVILPTTSPEVRFVLSGTTAVIARAHVSVGVSGFRAGVELQGRFAEQRLTVSLIANALSGLSGMCDYQIQAISLRLIAYLEVLWRRVYSTTLVSWGSGFVGTDLLNL